MANTPPAFDERPERQLALNPVWECAVDYDLNQLHYASSGTVISEVAAQTVHVNPVTIVTSHALLLLLTVSR